MNDFFFSTLSCACSACARRCCSRRRSADLVNSPRPGNSLTFLRSPESLSTIRCSPRISPRSICARIWASEKGPKSSLSFWTSQRSWFSSPTAPAASMTLKGVPSVRRPPSPIATGCAAICGEETPAMTGAWPTTPLLAAPLGATPSGTAPRLTPLDGRFRRGGGLGRRRALGGDGPVERPLEFGRRCPARLRTAAQRALDDRVDRRRDVGGELAHRRRRAGGRLTRQHLVQDHPQREDVGGGRRRPARDHLGGQVKVVGAAGRRAPATKRRQGAAEAEVGDLDPPGLVDPDAGGVEATVGHQVLRLLQAVGDVRQEIERALERDAPPVGALAVHELAQVLAVHQLGGDEVEVGFAPDHQHRDQVLVDDGAGLLDVDLQRVGAGPQQAQRDHADRGGRPLAGVERAVDATDVVLGDRLFDTKPAADHRACGHLTGSGGGGRRITCGCHRE